MDTCDARRVAGSRYNRWLLGRHRHQDVSPVDGEVTSNADGNPEYPDGILDHVIGLLQTQPVLGQKRLEDVLVETGRLGQQFMSTAQVQAAKSDPARNHHGLLPHPEVPRAGNGTSEQPFAQGLADHRRRQVITRFLSGVSGLSDCGPLGPRRRQNAETQPRSHPPPYCG